MVTAAKPHQKQVCLILNNQSISHDSLLLFSIVQDIILAVAQFGQRALRGNGVDFMGI